MVHLRNALVGLIATASFVTAHPGADIEAEIMERHAYFKNPNAKRSLAHCAEHFEKRGINERAIKRRAAAVEKLRRELAIKSMISSMRGRRNADELQSAEP